MKLAGKLGATIAGAVMAIGMSSVPASADHEFWQYQGDDRGRFRASDDVVIIEDREEDGHCAYVRWHNEGVSDSWKYLYDVDCAGPDRGVRDITGLIPATSAGIYLQVCENDGGCTASHLWPK
ncbi:hypothetical protein [Actinophytocola algeriensis]|jgi:hypothetical protein|uniref:Ricin-type beta-trefoil lectin protein n=1 Tax=Actinophytocola algeriensis TaxID=1768010 RepID=A0A7W7VDG2_9PSEU|nr:hypothetical protein [Actinophytocola algeriensis]MBB4906059.1 hypothetical protein [Actinophytocola algeriensis]MBE1472256.1 hypothetical protein [Actinophytocola algeriensis]